MKKITLTIISCLTTLIVNAQTPQFEWAHQLGTDEGGDNYVTSVAVDTAGNVYTAGTFSGIVDFDPDPINTHYLTTRGWYDMFVSKSDANGNLIWVKQMGGKEGIGLCQLRAIALDAFGNVYTTGTFTDTVDFDPDSINTYNQVALVGAGWGFGIQDDIFVSKLNSDGNFVWAKRMGGLYRDHASAIAIDANNNVYTTGYFADDTADFDPDPINTFYLNSPTGNINMFISKLDVNGNFVWAKQVASDSYSGGIALTNDALGNVYSTGSFSGTTTDFDPDPINTYNLTCAGINDIFISKLDTDGNFLWARGFGSTGPESGSGIAVDETGNVYTAGIFTNDTIDFDPGTGTVNLIASGESGNATFVSKLDATGNFVWAKQLGGSFNSVAAAQNLKLDASNNIYITGTLKDLNDFDPDSTNVYNLSGGFYYATFIAKLNSMGNFVWAKQLGENFVIPAAIDIDRSTNSIYTVGTFDGLGDFDPDSITYYNLIPLGYRDGFIHKMSQCVSSLGITTIFLVGDSLKATLAATYQWYKNGTPIPGANTQSYFPTENGDYSVCSTAHGETCKVCSDIYSISTNIVENSLTNAISVYPNPNHGQYEIVLDLNTQGNYTLELTNALGQILYHEELKNFIGTYQKQLDETNYGAGIYLFKVKNAKELSVKKVISF